MRREAPPDGVMLIMPAAVDDLPAIEELLRKCHLPIEGVAGDPGGFLVARWTSREPDPSAIPPDAIVGCIGVEVHGEGCLIRSFAIAPAFRGRGVMRPLVDAALQKARDLGCRKAFMLTLTIEALARREGFERVDRADVPEAILQSGEFRLTCCNSAVVLRKNLDMRRSWQV